MFLGCNGEVTKEEQETDVTQTKKNESSSLKEINEFIEKEEVRVPQKKVDLSSSFLNEDNVAIDDKSVIANSLDDFKIVFGCDFFRDFPFDPGDWLCEFPSQAIVIYKLDYSDFLTFIIGYGGGSTSTTLYDTYLITVRLDGEIIDIVQLPYFISGKGDVLDFITSNFAARFGTPGFSEIKFTENRVFCNSSYFKIYTDSRTEEISREVLEAEISDEGEIQIIENKRYEPFYYYKNKVIDASYDDQIKMFS